MYRLKIQLLFIFPYENIKVKQNFVKKWHIFRNKFCFNNSLIVASSTGFDLYFDSIGIVL